MKISEKNNLEHMEGAGKTKGAQKRGSVSGKTSEASPKDISSLENLGSAKVKLSERAQDMKKVRSNVDSTPDVDEAKVAKFKSMIAKGEYKVDAQKVADKMVDEHAYGELFKSDTE